ncbi:MAG: DUF805 domain-containing protein [Sandaracinobacter sp.]
MSLMFEPLKKYATFRGRARRTEYWLWQLFLILVFGVLTAWLFAQAGPIPPGATPEEISAILEAKPGTTLPALLIAIASLGLFLPTFAVSVRRLHDSDKSGWWLLLNLTAIGGLVLFIFYLLDGTPGPNRHGADPKGRSLA